MLGDHTKTADLPDLGPQLIPDALGTISAWRTWDVSGESGSLLLVSPNGKFVWMPSQRGQAVCGDKTSMCDNVECGCGFNGFARRHKLFIQYTTQPVWGMVNLWGQVRLYRKGCRGLYAYPDQLFVDPLHYDTRAEARQIAQEIASTYQVPTRVRCRPGHKLVYAARQMWRSPLGRPARYLAHLAVRPVLRQDDRALGWWRSCALAMLPLVAIASTITLICVLNTQTIMLAETFEHPRFVFVLAQLGLMALGIMLTIMWMIKLDNSEVGKLWGEFMGMPGLLVIVALVMGGVSIAVTPADDNSWDPSIQQVNWSRYADQAKTREQPVKMQLTDKTRDSFEDTYGLVGSFSRCQSADDAGAVLVCRTRDHVSWHDAERLAQLGKSQ